MEGGRPNEPSRRILPVTKADRDEILKAGDIPILQAHALDSLSRASWFIQVCPAGEHPIMLVGKEHLALQCKTNAFVFWPTSMAPSCNKPSRSTRCVHFEVHETT